MEALIRYRTSGTRLQNGWGYPMMMDTYAPLKFIISPKETVIASQYREFRHIPTDGAPMVPEDERWPTIWGTSNGCAGKATRWWSRRSASASSSTSTILRRNFPKMPGSLNGCG